MKIQKIVQNFFVDKVSSYRVHEARLITSIVQGHYVSFGLRGVLIGDFVPFILYNIMLGC